MEDQASVLVVLPDAGGAKRANYLTKLLKIRCQVLDKKRTGHGKAETSFYLDLTKLVNLSLNF
ncbi:MAG: hypothetical protein HVK24_03260 [Pelagibacteraceae bacterium]|nr:hypothetical protein [Pelagibacteraceae bacterium]